jgi:alpha-D-ribose 1-methylphosphonate 5-triphosphate synthase subunit PhnI
MGLACARVMNEGSLYDLDLAALALKQAQGDAIEAAFLMRAYRTTLPRFGSSEPVDTAQMAIRRRVSATYKDLPGGQVLGPTYDYTHRLFDFALMEEGKPRQ